MTNFAAPDAGSMTPEEYYNHLETLREKLAPTTPRDRLFDTHQELTTKALETMRLKNEGYANVADPYANFRMFGLLGIVVRLSDKVARLKSFLENGIDQVQDESIKDTIEDAINYAVLFEAMRREGTQK